MISYGFLSTCLRHSRHRAEKAVLREQFTWPSISGSTFNSFCYFSMCLSSGVWRYGGGQCVCVCLWLVCGCRVVEPRPALLVFEISIMIRIIFSIMISMPISIMLTIRINNAGEADKSTVTNLKSGARGNKHKEAS